MTIQLSAGLKKCGFYQFGTQRCLAQADTRGIKHGVGDCGGDRARCRLTGTQRQLIRMVDQNDVDFFRAPLISRIG